MWTVVGLLLALEVPDGVAPAQAKACADGDAAACAEIAFKIAPKGGFRADLPKAEADARAARTERFALRACDLGNGEACALAGHFGKYSLLDERLKRGCDLGYVDACGNLGMRKFPAPGNPDAASLKKQAVALVERACLANARDKRNPDDGPGGYCHALFSWYHDKELPQDRKAERRYLELACKQGFHIDCPCKSEKDCGEGQVCNEGTCDVDSSE